MAKVTIKGVIVGDDEKWIYDWFGIQATSPRDVAKEIAAANGGDLEVDINSGGGSVFAGSEIYTALKSYTGNVTVRILGIAASAASVIAMAGKKVTISPTAQIMIHNVSSRQEGDHRNMEHMAKVLRGADETIANAYMLKTGMTQDEILALMGEETWMTPQKALEHGFVDEVMFQEIKLAASYCNMLPAEVVEKMRNTRHENLMKAQERQNALQSKGDTK
jgi:ATP-dependent Clp protease protease subunit